MEENNNNNQKPECWQGTVFSSTLQGIQPDEAWSLLGDFCSIHKFFPAITTSHRFEGTDNEPGCVRYCVGGFGWAKEKLVNIDTVGRSYSYNIVESSTVFGKYFATLKVVSAGEDGCRIEWSFEADPIEGFTLPGFVSFLQSVVEEVASLVGDHACRAKQ